MKMLPPLFRRLLRSTVPALLMLTAVACGSPIEQQESSYSDRQNKLDALVAKADGPTKIELTTKKADIAKRYAALPADKSARSEGLGKLNQELRAALDTYEPKVEAESKNASSAAFTKGLAELAGTWKGVGMEMTIAHDGGFNYEKKSGGTSKSLTGKVTKVSGDSFEAGALGLSTTFKIDKRPYDEGGKKMMVVDGTPLTRVD
jgi:hypothetical protein